MEQTIMTQEDAGEDSVLGNERTATPPSVATPRPWRVDDEFSVVAECGPVIATVLSYSDFPCVDEEDEEACDAEARANAALIVHAVNCHDELVAALKSAIAIAEEARLEWDAAPSGMRAGKLLIALAGHIKRYRPDIDKIHAALAKAMPQTVVSDDAITPNTDPSPDQTAVP